MPIQTEHIAPTALQFDVKLHVALGARLNNKEENKCEQVFFDDAAPKQDNFIHVFGSERLSPNDTTINRTRTVLLEAEQSINSIRKR
jgi:hypothetical protein